MNTHTKNHSQEHQNYNFFLFMGNLLLLLLLLLLLSIATATGSAPEPGSPSFIQSHGPAPKTARRQKLTHFRVYWHDIVAGLHPTAVPVAQAATTNASATFFGLVRMIDNPLTLGPGIDSTLVGRAQGFYASAAQESVGLMMVMNFEFVEGKYNGSTVTVLGRNAVFTAVREMPVIGGSGLFRWAQGYAQARTHSYDAKTGNAVVEYNVYVVHY